MGSLQEARRHMGIQCLWSVRGKWTLLCWVGCLMLQQRWSTFGWRVYLYGSLARRREALRRLSKRCSRTHRACSETYCLLLARRFRVLFVPLLLFLPPKPPSPLPKPTIYAVLPSPHFSNFPSLDTYRYPSVRHSCPCGYHAVFYHSMRGIRLSQVAFE
jgi:hypothetical protein